MVTPIACDSISSRGCKSSTCAPWLQLESIEHNILILHESLVQTCPSRCFTSDENTQPVCCQAAKPAKKLCVCDKSVPQSQSSHSHTTFTNVDLRAQTRKNSAEQERPCATPRSVGADILQDEPLGLIDAKCRHKLVVSSDMLCCFSESTSNVLTQMRVELKHTLT